MNRLDQRLARLVATSRAAHYLTEQLERALRRAEICEPESDVGRNDTDERHLRKVMALRDHLRADENVDLTGAHAVQHGADRAVALGALLARFAVVFGLLPVLEATRLVQPVSVRYKTILVWGGLRGAVTIVLAMVAALRPEEFLGGARSVGSRCSGAGRAA